MNRWRRLMPIIRKSVLPPNSSLNDSASMLGLYLDQAGERRMR